MTTSTITLTSPSELRQAETGDAPARCNGGHRGRRTFRTTCLRVAASALAMLGVATLLAGIAPEVAGASTVATTMTFKYGRSALPGVSVKVYTSGGSLVFSGTTTSAGKVSMRLTSGAKYRIWANRVVGNPSDCYSASGPVGHYYYNTYSPYLYWYAGASAVTVALAFAWTC